MPVSATYILGCPRSGTTWLHNTLIAVGRFAGIPRDDIIGTTSRSVFETDENRYVHAALLRKAVGQKNLISETLPLIRALIYARFGKSGEFMLKSPYFCFFLDTLAATGRNDRFIFVKRSLDSVANSMLRHPHLSALLDAPYEGFFDMRVQSCNVETRYVPLSLTERFQAEYLQLTRYDRALFKCLCFVSAFFGDRSRLPADRLFVFDYDKFASSVAAQTTFANFLHITKDQLGSMLSQFSPAPAKSIEASHCTDFRLAVMQAHAALWSGF